MVADAFLAMAGVAWLAWVPSHAAPVVNGVLARGYERLVCVRVEMNDAIVVHSE
jgi:hypothetical protein